MTDHPYRGRPGRSFWTSAVSPTDVVPREIHMPKWPIAPTDRIATAGSCFAQHIGRNLKARGFQVIDVEPPPAGLPAAEHKTFGFGIYSARYGNVYTTRQLLQLTREALGDFAPADVVWPAKGGGYCDGLRPGIEPEGLPSPEDVLHHRRFHLAAVRRMLESVDVFVFTLGLTETWEHAPSGTVYPTAPGTVAGRYDPSVHAFRNLGFADVLADLEAFRDIVRSLRPGARFLLTVSPVPLAATAAPDHVLVATVHSKSVLRAVAGEMARRFDDVDYFPSYEIVTNPWGEQRHYQPNLRDVRPESVDRVMEAFFRAHGVEAAADPDATGQATKAPPAEAADAPDDGGGLVCEEAMLAAFGPRESAA